MALSKRLRYEILRRDNYTCRYCGTSAPDVKLTVDHVHPVALGGLNDATNLVAACTDCNAGKTSSSPDAPIAAQVAEDAIRWARTIEVAVAQREADRIQLAETIQIFDKSWSGWTFTDTGEVVPRDADWQQTLQRMLGRGLTIFDLLDGIQRTMNQRGVRDNWSYFCGICWDALTEIERSARRLLECDDKLRVEAK